MDPLDDFKARNPGVHLEDFLADVRDAFGHLEAAISLVEPARCRGYVSDSFYQSVDSEVAALARRGRRRVHAGFEVLDVVLEEARLAGGLSVRLHAVSTLEEFDAAGPPTGQRSQYIWTQDVDMVRQERGEAESRWVIAGLGAMTIEKEVSGPVRTLDQATLAEMDAWAAERAAHDKEDEAWSEGQTHVSLSFLRLRPGM
jgi:hypothetical protein